MERDGTRLTQFRRRFRATNGEGECAYRNKDYLRAKAFYKEALNYASTIRKEVRGHASSVFWGFQGSYDDPFSLATKVDMAIAYGDIGLAILSDA